MNEELLATEETLHENYIKLQLREKELLESRADFQDVLDNSIVALYKRDFRDDRYDYMSPAITEIIGYTPDEMVRFTLEEAYAIIHPDDRARVSTILDDLIQKGGGKCLFEYRVNHKKGQEVWVKDIFRVVVDEFGKPLYSIGSIQDITERKKIELIAKKSQEKLAHLNHVTFQDILNTSFALIGYIELMKEENNDENLLLYLQTVESLIQKNDEILRSAKTYQDMGSKNPAWHNIAIVVLNAISHLSLSNLSRTMELEGLECYADPLLEQVFSVILENVVVHTRNATYLSLTCHEEEGTLALIIEDDGGGVPDEVKATIFERSYARKKGLGLFLAREILSLTGITITENGVFGKGARFEIRIPGSGYRFENPE